MDQSSLSRMAVLCAVFLAFSASAVIAEKTPLKTYSGPYLKGTVTYTYYEDGNGDRVYHGKYRYTGSQLVSSISQKVDAGWIGGSWNRDKGGQYSEQGEFKDGQQHGMWKFTYKGVIQRNPMGDAYYESDISQTVSGHYADGCRTGKWTIQGTQKSKKPGLLSQKISGSVEFKDGHFVGPFEYKCEESGKVGDDGFSVSGRFDSNGHLDGEWVVLADNGNWVAGTKDPRDLRYVIDHGVIKSAILKEAATGKVLDRATTFQRHDADDKYIGIAHARISASFGYDVDGNGCSGYPKVRIYGPEGDKLQSEYHYGRVQTLVKDTATFRSALVEIDRAVSLRPDYYFYRLQRGRILADAAFARYDSAIIELEQAIALAYNASNRSEAVWSVQATRGQVLLDAKRYDSAYSALKEAVALKPNWGYVQLGIASYELGKHDEAFAAFDRAAQDNPNDEYTLWYRAYYLYESDRYAKAIEDYQKLSKLAPANAEYPAKMGWGYYSLEEFEKSISESSRAVELDPTLNYARYNIAIALLRQGKKEEAMKVYRSVQKPNDAVPGAIENLKGMVEKGVMVTEAQSVLQEIFNQQ